MSERAPSWAKKPQQKCGTCKHLRPRSDGKPFWHGHAYACQWTPPEIAYPDSWRHHRGRSVTGNIGTYMAPGDGKDCPCWEKAAPRNGEQT